MSKINKLSISGRSLSLLCIGLYILICHLVLGYLWIGSLQIQLLRPMSFVSLIEHSMTSFVILLSGALLLDISCKEINNKK